MTDVLFSWILLRTIAMLFRMLCKGSTRTIHRPHYILLLPIIKSKNISTASVTEYYQISLSCCSCFCLSHAPEFDNFVTKVTCSLLYWWSSIQIQEFQKFNKSSSPSRWPSVECRVEFFLPQVMVRALVII